MFTILLLRVEHWDPPIPFMVISCLDLLNLKALCNEFFDGAIFAHY